MYLIKTDLIKTDLIKTDLIKTDCLQKEKSNNENVGNEWDRNKYFQKFFASHYSPLNITLIYLFCILFFLPYCSFNVTLIYLLESTLQLWLIFSFFPDTSFNFPSCHTFRVLKFQQEISGVSYNIKQKKSSQQRFGSGSLSLSLSKMLKTFLFFTGMFFLNITFQYIFKLFYLHLYLFLYSINIPHLNGLQTGRYFCHLQCHFLL